MTTTATAPAPVNSAWQWMPPLGVREMPLVAGVRPPGWSSIPTPEQLAWSVAWMAINRPGG